MANRSELKNIKAPEWKPPSWKAADVTASLESLRDYIEKYAQAAIDWYYRRKAWKARISQTLRALAVIAAAVGTLMPVLASLVSSNGSGNQPGPSVQVHQFGYVCFGVAAL